ncbi:Pentatricopeptide repeat [Macleaya cordata]|uniref:Pentatricopeptide repeat n=1 Tax=Macleaya cordata TaxID=56857 RepID=A0A200QWV0_MACCD|nr:Pentatricopeptide repeat [Macleaya cordata]
MIQILTFRNRYCSRQKRTCLNFRVFHNHPRPYSIQLEKPNNANNPKLKKPLQPPSYASILQGLRELEPLQQVHGRIITSGLEHNIFLSNRLMNSYASCGVLTVAELIFHRIRCKTVVSWTILISGFAKNDFYNEAFEVFCKMKMSGFLPNAVTLTSILPVFANLGLIQFGRSVHCLLIRFGLEINIFVETSLVDMYAKCGLLSVARKQFDAMPEKNVVSWNAIISGYSDYGFGEEALHLFKTMQRNGFTADFITVMSLIAACSSIACLQIGYLIRSFTIRSGFDNDLLVKTALMEMYVKLKCVEDAFRIFNEEMLVKDVVTWTLMLSSFSDAGYGNKAMDILNEMITMDGISLDSVALMGMISSCSKSGSMQQGRRVHGLTIKTGFEDYTFVGSAFIDMYSNCGSLDSAKKFFEGMEETDVVCWNSMIAGLGMNGYGDDAVDLFLRMKGSGIEPNNSTFVCVLCACSHAGMVDKGLQIFDLMFKKWNIVPNLQHYSCIVDLLGRAGQLDDAYSLINNMPLKPDAGVYGALLAACNVHRNIKLGLEISQKLFQLELNDAGYYVLLSNMHATAGNWEGVKMTRVSLRSKGLKKDPGRSSIEIDRTVHTFMAGDKYHPQYPEISDFLRSLIERIEAAGHVPDTKFVFQDVPDEVKRDLLYHHSEKLAIAFGLLRSKPGTTIRIVKNLRICNDCHNASKFISKTFGRELIIKDINHFHTFQDGVCSCKDFW